MNSREEEAALTDFPCFYSLRGQLAHCCALRYFDSTRFPTPKQYQANRASLPLIIRTGQSRKPRGGCTNNPVTVLNALFAK